MYDDESFNENLKKMHEAVKYQSRKWNVNYRNKKRNRLKIDIESYQAFE